MKMLYDFSIVLRDATWKDKNYQKLKKVGFYMT